MKEDLDDTTDATSLHPSTARWFVVALGCGVFVLTAVVLEVVGGMHANSVVPTWAELVPIAWPQGTRVAWWLAVAASAGGFRLGLHRSGFPQHRWMVAASVLPFMAFAIGIAFEADWATWH